MFCDQQKYVSKFVKFFRVLYTSFNKRYSVKLVTCLGGCYICDFIIWTSEQNKILDIGLNKYTCMHNLRRNLTICL